MPIIKLPGPGGTREGVFEGSPFAETFSEFLIGQGINAVDPSNLTGQADAFRSSFETTPDPSRSGIRPVDRKILKGIPRDRPAEFLGNQELSDLLRGVSKRSGDPFGAFDDISELNPGGAGKAFTRNTQAAKRKNLKAQQQAFDKLFEAGIGEFSQRLRGTRATPAEFQVKGGQRSRRSEFV